MIMQDYNRSENYINRELSWLDFNLRVLHEARDKENPLFERLKFLAITSSNLGACCVSYKFGDFRL